jgi:hypothetical protein
MEFVVFALAGLIIALLVIVDRQGKRHHEENQAHRLEVAALCQRLQAPELAVMEHNHAQIAEAPGVTHAMTDEQAAEAEERARVIAEMERIENEALR